MNIVIMTVNILIEESKLARDKDHSHVKSPAVEIARQLNGNTPAFLECWLVATHVQYLIESY